MSAHVNGPLGVSTYDAWATATPDDYAVAPWSDLSGAELPQVASEDRSAWTATDWLRHHAYPRGTR